VDHDVFINLTPFLDYLRTTKTIRMMKLFHITGLGDSAVGRLIRAIDANPHIEQVDCGARPYEEFLSFLQDKAQTLKRLTTTIEFSGDSTELPNSIGSLQALNHFSLGYTRDAPLQASILQSICSSLHSLTISLCQSEDVVDALVTFLRSTNFLETFETRSFHFDKKLMEKSLFSHPSSNPYL
jgi:hypothetical protein